MRVEVGVVRVDDERAVVGVTAMGMGWVSSWVDLGESSTEVDEAFPEGFE